MDHLFEDADTNIGSALLGERELPTIGGMASRSRIEPRLGHAISQLGYRSPTAGNVEVRCWSKEEWPLVKLEWAAYVGTSGDAAGFTFDVDRVSVAPKYCAALARFLYRHQRPTRGIALVDMAESFGLFAHETGHLFGTLLNEARTECYGVQHVRELARILGADQSYAALLAETNWKYVYPFLPRDYRTGACRNGGLLDEHPNSDVWP